MEDYSVAVHRLRHAAGHGGTAVPHRRHQPATGRWCSWSGQLENSTWEILAQHKADGGQVEMDDLPLWVLQIVLSAPTLPNQIKKHRLG